jgi:mercuric ion binding protein
MKTFKLFFTVLLALGLCVSSSAQTNDGSKMSTTISKTETFKVYGNCVMCKDRIEKVVKAEGAETASWDLKTKMLTVNYDPSKTSKDGLCKKLAAVGHDTEKYKAPDDVYAKLPGCCHYERSK